MRLIVVENASRRHGCSPKYSVGSGSSDADLNGYPAGLAQGMVHSPGSTVWVTSVHGNVWEVPAVEIRLGHQKGERAVTPGLIPDLPVPLLVGWD